MSGEWKLALDHPFSQISLMLALGCAGESKAGDGNGRHTIDL
jgi:hypothetical protein